MPTQSLEMFFDRNLFICNVLQFLEIFYRPGRHGVRRHFFPVISLVGNPYEAIFAAEVRLDWLLKKATELRGFSC